MCSVSLAFSSPTGCQQASSLHFTANGTWIESAYGQAPKPEPFCPEELDGLLNRSQPMRLTLIGFGGLDLIAWLMMFKPF